MASATPRLSLRWIALGIGVGLALMTCRPAYALEPVSVEVEDLGGSRFALVHDQHSS